LEARKLENWSDRQFGTSSGTSFASVSYHFARLKLPAILLIHSQSISFLANYPQNYQNLLGNYCTFHQKMLEEN